MTEFTIDQALKQGIEAHKSGQVQQADRLYTAIIKAHPKHPDANHNMGVLAVGLGKVQEALPFFKTALEANPAKAQFWLSYIDALIKHNKLAEAKTVFDQAKSKGAKGEGFDELGQRLQEAAQEPPKSSKIVSEPQPKQQNILDSLKLDQAIKLAKKKAKEGALQEARRVYQDILAKFPKNKRASDGIKALAGSPVGIASKVQDPPQAQLQSLINLYSQGQIQQALKQSEILVHQFPRSAVLFNIQGAFFKGLRQLNQSIAAYNKALIIKPDFAEAYYNMSLTLEDQGKLEEAIEAYKKAIAIKSDYADAYFNMANALREQGKLEESIVAYNKALAIKPDNVAAQTNLGVAFKEQGMLEEALEAYKKALAIKPDYPDIYNNMGNALKEQGMLDEAMASYSKALHINLDNAKALENSQSLAVQLLPIIGSYGFDFDNNEIQVNSEVVLGPKYQIHNAIKSYLEEDFNNAELHIKNFNTCDQKLFAKLAPKDKVFCNAYSKFIMKLLSANWDNAPTSKIEKKVYHFGESHCLSYAHRSISIDGSIFKITPRITFGAKAFHLSQTRQDSFKSITKANFEILPKNSKVFLSYGEIDCRPNEGFITAARKLKKPINQLITDTVTGYVQWFAEQNRGQSHRLYFINVPAPVYYNEHSADLNSEVLRTVTLFNAALKKYSLQHGFDMVDVFKFTTGNKGFSNGLYHVDKIHLGAKALLQIEQQLF